MTESERSYLHKDQHLPSLLLYTAQATEETQAQLLTMNGTEHKTVIKQEVDAINKCPECYLCG